MLNTTGCSRGGVSFLLDSNLVATPLFHSKSSNSSKSGGTHPKSAVGSKDVADALKAFDEMLHGRPLPCAVHFTRILAPLVKLKQYPTVLAPI